MSKALKKNRTFKTSTFRDDTALKTLLNDTKNRGEREITRLRLFLSRYEKRDRYRNSLGIFNESK